MGESRDSRSQGFASQPVEMEQQGPGSVRHCPERWSALGSELACMGAGMCVYRQAHAHRKGAGKGSLCDRCVVPGMQLGLKLEEK